MILKQYYLGCLAHASYLIADEASGEAAVVDPQRDVDEYVEDARRLGCRIGHVFLTHFHADFVAGHLELRDREGARICLGARAAAEYEFTPFRDRESIRLGQVRLEVLETPGHSPESISVLVYDLDADDARPHAVLSGDTLFIGDVGRPDLRASLGWSAEELGGMLYDSLHGKLLTLPDDVLVYPAHGAGSLCGKNLSTDTVSTIGVQRHYNYALQPMSRDDFVRVVTAEQPDSPAYFTYDAVLNTKERPTLEQVIEEELRPLSLEETLALATQGAQLLDAREPADFAGAHLTGSVNVGLGGSYATWSGTILEQERPIVIVAEPGREQEAALRLGRIGFDTVAGYLEDGMQALEPRPDLVGRVERIAAATLAERLADPDAPLVLDVRTQREWRDHRIEGSLNIPLGRLLERLGEVPRDRPIVVHCGTGYRSAIAASLLLRHGFDSITDLVGGIAAWDASSSDGVHEIADPLARLPTLPRIAAKNRALVVWTDEPLNAETPLDVLCRATVTPTGLFYVRNHAPVPQVDPASYVLTVGGLVREPLSLPLDDLRRRFDRVAVGATLMCAGNRRSELAAIRPIPGQAPWGAGAIGHAVWSGVRLRDVLLAAGVDAQTGHVAFTGLDQAEEEGELTEFGGSIPLERALGPDVLLADEMNGEPLPALHGYPLRVVVPGYIGARSVKWLSTITVQPDPSTNYFQARTYRLFPSHVRTETSTQDHGVALGELPVNAVVCSPLDGEAVRGRLRARGYAITGGTRRIERVEVSLDQGENFLTAELLDGGDAGSWRLWEADLEVEPGPGELVVRAWDSAASTQPEDAAKIWNLKGYLNNAWHRVRFTAIQ
jgi:DMSO/TMAO reductase YedYZ molybdopterin-dependent catalytic subunit/glyoxylase-like metal-dependent hydrolase (beta-lactamase superfamily II)/rhodanese-related sulfurtransferase